MRSSVILAALLLVAAGVRLASCGKYIFMDEDHVLAGNVFHFLADRTFLPRHLSYPTLYSYLATPATWLAGRVLTRAGDLGSPLDIIGLRYLDSARAFLPARLTSVMFGLGTILVVYALGKRLRGVHAGLFAAAILTVSPLHVDFSSWALPDAALAFFSAVSVLYCLYALRTGRTRDFVLAGAFAGLAVSTKYNGAIIAASAGAALWLLGRAGGSPRPSTSRKLWLAVAYALSAAATFAVGSPGWLVEPGAFWRAFRFEQQHMAIGHLGQSGLPYVHHLHLLWISETTVGVAFVAAVGWALVRRRPEQLVLLAPVLLGFVYIGSWAKQSLHYMLLMWPALSGLAGLMLAEVLQGVRQRVGRPRRAALVSGGVLAAVLLWPSVCVTAFAHQQLGTDSRWVAQQWVQANVPEGTTVAVDWAYLPKLFTPEQKAGLHGSRVLSEQLYRKRLAGMRTYRLTPIAYDTAWLGSTDAEYLVTSSGCFDRYFTTAEPSRRSPLWEEFVGRRAFYAALLSTGGGDRWRREREFNTGKGPRVVVFRRVS